jgi:hypothetical protein
MNYEQIADTVIAITKQANGPGRGTNEARNLWKLNFRELQNL